MTTNAGNSHADDATRTEPRTGLRFETAGGQDAHGREDQSQRRQSRALREWIRAAAQKRNRIANTGSSATGSVTNGSLTGVSAGSVAGNLPHLQNAAIELSPIIMQHLDRLRQQGKGWIRFSLRMPDGRSLGMRLGLSGSKVSVTLLDADPGMQEALSGQWGKLRDGARSRGLELGLPGFEGAVGPNTSFGKVSRSVTYKQSRDALQPSPMETSR